MAWRGARKEDPGGTRARGFAGLQPLTPDPSGTTWAFDVYLLAFNLASTSGW